MCNGVLLPVDRSDVAPLLQPGTLRDHEKFAACALCGKVYWEGAHHARISGLIAAARAADMVPTGREEPARRTRRLDRDGVDRGRIMRG